MFNQEAVAGLIRGIGPCEGGRVLQAILAKTKTAREKTKFMGCVAKEAEPPRSLKHSDVWMDAMRSEFDGLEVAGIFVEASELPADGNAVESKWMLKWKGDAQVTGRRARHDR